MRVARIGEAERLHRVDTTFGRQHLLTLRHIVFEDLPLARVGLHHPHMFERVFLALGRAEVDAPHARERDFVDRFPGIGQHWVFE